MVRPKVVRELPTEQLELLTKFLTERSLDLGDSEAGRVLGRFVIYWAAAAQLGMSPLVREVWVGGRSGLMSLCVRLLGALEAGDRAAVNAPEPAGASP